jgi:hypothetical protein
VEGRLTTTHWRLAAKKLQASNVIRLEVEREVKGLGHHLSAADQQGFPHSDVMPRLKARHLPPPT